MRVPIRFMRDAGLSDLLASQAELVCTGFDFTEGPIWVPDGGYLLFSDIPLSRIHRWRPGSTLAEVYRHPSGRTNGLTLDGEGRLLACEHAGRRVSRVARDGEPETLADRYDGKRLHSPNDVVVHSSGAVYFTDPAIGYLENPAAPHELDVQGVYRVSTDGEVALVEERLATPNGLAFSPDESTLYIADSLPAMMIYRYRALADGGLEGREPFIDMRPFAHPRWRRGLSRLLRRQPRRGVPDGIKVDEDGRVWVAGVGGIWVVEPEGRLLGIAAPPQQAANIAFGGSDFSTLYLTAQNSVYRVATSVRGIAPGSR